MGSALVVFILNIAVKQYRIISYSQNSEIGLLPMSTLVQVDNHTAQILMKLIKFLNNCNWLHQDISPDVAPDIESVQYSLSS